MAQRFRLAVGVAHWLLLATLCLTQSSAPASKTRLDALESLDALVVQAQSGNVAACPRPSAAVMQSCKRLTWNNLPQPALAVLRRLKCDAGSNYAYGTAIHLASGSHEPYYEVCCHDAPHGPCSAVLLGVVHGRWTNLTDHYGLEGFDNACGGLLALNSAHAGFHDLCLPNQCSAAQQNRCQPEILEMTDHGYEPASTAPARSR